MVTQSDSDRTVNEDEKLSQDAVKEEGNTRDYSMFSYEKEFCDSKSFFLHEMLVEKSCIKKTFIAIRISFKINKNVENSQLPPL